MNIEFSGGEAWEKALAKIEEMATNSGVLKVGFLEGRKYPDGTPVAEVAVKQEYGDPNNVYRSKNHHKGQGIIRHMPIPARPFFRNAIANNKDSWSGQIVKIAQAQNYNVEAILTSMGEIIRREIVDEINEMQDPPNSAFTIAQKGFNKPLIDTGYMRDSVDYETETK